MSNAEFERLLSFAIIDFSSNMLVVVVTIEVTS